MSMVRRALAPVLAGVVAGGVLVACDGGPDEDDGPPGRGPLTLVSAGDSTLSGEGTGEYTAGTDGRDGNWCRRSPKSAIHRTSVPGIEKTVNLACAGAATQHVRLTDEKVSTEGSQAAQLRELTETHRVAGVFVAIGANDEPRFATRMTECLKAYWTGTPCSQRLSREWESIVDSMAGNVVLALQDIRKVLAEADYDEEDYQLIVLSYPSPVSPAIPENLRSLAGCPFHPADLRWISTEGIRVLSEGIRRAADEVGARFLDLSRSAVGHEACTGGQNTQVEWFRRLTVNWDDIGDVNRASQAAKESFHGNVRWHARLAECLTEFYATDDESAACLEGDDGALHPAPAPSGQE